MAIHRQHRCQYVYLSRRHGKRVVRQYIGRGPEAQLACALLRLRANQRAEVRQRLAGDEAKFTGCEKYLDEFTLEVSRLVRLGMYVAGYRQHNRGHWRRRRASN